MYILGVRASLLRGEHYLLHLRPSLPVILSYAPACDVASTVSLTYERSDI